MSTRTPLGDYLRARRELVSPESVGLSTKGQRRVPGLRREEVAVLAGISSDYYLRLEQGRDDNPSLDVLEALAGALLLDETATTYLIGLSAPEHRRTPRRDRRESVPVGIRQLVATIGLPAFVENRRFDVLAANDLARALSPTLSIGVNRLRALFLDPGEQALCPNTERAMAHQVASFRQSVGSDTDDPRVVELVDELSQASERFRQLWARHDVHANEGTQRAMYHPRVGDITLHKERLHINGADGLSLVVYHAVPGTANAEKLARLAG